MPIENEVKILLIRHQAKQAIETAGLSGLHIQQGYLTNGTRIRKTTVANQEPEFLFTHKEETRHGLVEIETPINETDFERLWENTKNRLVKTRFKMKTDKASWDLDFLGGFDNPYIVLVEAEMAEGETEPGALPDEIASCDNLAVGKDPRFLNWRLADEAATTALLRELHWDQATEAA